MNAVLRSLAPESRARTRVDARDSLARLIALMAMLAAEGRSVLSDLIEQGTRTPELTHLPAEDAYDAASGYRWYYHSHAQHGRTPGEHGHFHLFRDETDGECVRHLLAISVDARGWPLAMFSPNAWVTDEAWAPAAALLRWIEGFGVRRPAHLHRVHEWLALMLRAFAPQVRELLLARDARVNALRRSARFAVLEDRRITVLSRCDLDLVHQAALLDRPLTHMPKAPRAR